jgi:hypothetical protein
MIETLIRDALVLPVRVFSGLDERRWSVGAEFVPRTKTGNSVALMTRSRPIRTILAR